MDNTEHLPVICLPAASTVFSTLILGVFISLGAIFVLFTNLQSKIPLLFWLIQFGGLLSDYAIVNVFKIKVSIFSDRIVQSGLFSTKTIIFSDVKGYSFESWRLKELQETIQVIDIYSKNKPLKIRVTEKYTNFEAIAKLLTTFKKLNPAEIW